MQEVAYEYRDVDMTSRDASYRLSAYKRFGWEVIDARIGEKTTLRMRRPLDDAQYDRWMSDEQDFDRALTRAQNAQRGHGRLSFSWLQELMPNRR